MNLIHIMKDDNGDFEPLDLSPVFYKGNTMYVPHWRIKNTWVFPGGQTYTTTELIGMGAKVSLSLLWPRGWVTKMLGRHNPAMLSQESLLSLIKGKTNAL
jgi:hypothetical protein